ncbi:hypothetical protein LguiB_018896 [Lonicera macranthoides]
MDGRTVFASQVKILLLLISHSSNLALVSLGQDSLPVTYFQRPFPFKKFRNSIDQLL